MVGDRPRDRASVRAVLNKFSHALENLGNAGAYCFASDLPPEATPSVRVDGMMDGWFEWPAQADEVVTRFQGERSEIPEYLLQIRSGNPPAVYHWEDFVHDGITRAVRDALQPAGTMEAYLSHMVIQSPEHNVTFSSDEWEANTTGVLVIALPSEHAGGAVTITNGAASTVWAPTAGSASYAAWYSACSVSIAPIAAGRKAYLVYELRPLERHVRRNAPADPASVPQTLAAIAADPRQFHTTYNYLPSTKTTALSWDDLDTADAAFVAALSASDSFDVALVQCRDPARRSISRVISRHLGERMPALLSDLESDHDEDDNFDDGYEEVTPEHVNLLAFRAMQRLYGHGGPQRFFHDEEEHDEPGPRCNEARPYGYDVTDFDDPPPESVAIADESGSEDGFEDDDSDSDVDSLSGSDSDEDDLLLGLTHRWPNHRMRESPVITKALVDSSVPAAVGDALVGHTVGQTIGHQRVGALLSDETVVVFWPRAHRVRLVGFDAGLARLRSSVAGTATDLLGYPSSGALAVALMEMLGDTSVATTEVQAEALARFVEATGDGALFHLYTVHCIDIRDGASRRRGLQWLRAVFAAHGWETVGAGVVELCANGSRDWKGLLLVLRFLRKLVAGVAQPYVAELVKGSWYALLTNLAALGDVNAGEWYYAVNLFCRQSILRNALHIEALVAATSPEAPQATWFGRRLPVPVLAIVESYLAPGKSLAEVVAALPHAFAPLRVILPVVLAMDPSMTTPRTAPYVTLIRRQIATATELPCQHLAAVFAMSAPIGLLVQAVNTAWTSHRTRSTLPLLAALRGGMAVSSADAAAICARVVQCTDVLNDDFTDRVFFGDGVGLDDTPPMRELHAVVAICHRLDPSALPAFFADLVAKVQPPSDLLYYVRVLLFPTIKYLDIKFPDLRPLRDELAAVCTPALEAFLKATRRTSPLNLSMVCTCRECQRVRRELANVAPTRSIDQLFGGSCARLRSFVENLPPHRRITVTLVGRRNVRIRMLSEAGVAAQRQRDEECLRYLRGGEMALPPTKKRLRTGSDKPTAKRQHLPEET
ncbi:hypothetical protein ACHHYP_13801 [Achlya hypogyna]|uniref:Uncharacterized protein n=1 Tax=Achlya hypogyna TaxID=1202772 RepID=A0A1V9ZFM5_ACHHY|nr:hypothetical protein ACHHYP_13801 [Achlya hypogyna]